MKRLKISFLLLLLIGLLGCSLLSQTPTVATNGRPSPMPPASPPKITPDIDLENYLAHQDDRIGFTFNYPPEMSLSQEDRSQTATITFPDRPNTNVVEEFITIDAWENTDQCASPLAEGWLPTEQTSETVQYNGAQFIRQSHTGVAAGTSRIWIANITQKEQPCVSIGFVLTTFDPGNLDPTRFPNPPISIDWNQEVRQFETIVSTFQWTR